MKFQPPGRDPVVSAHRIKAAHLGSLGMSPRQASILVTDPLVPRWMNDPRTTWEARSLRLTPGVPAT
jgi:hypothetical protein